MLNTPQIVTKIPIPTHSAALRCMVATRDRPNSVRNICPTGPANVKWVPAQIKPPLIDKHGPAISSKYGACASTPANSKIMPNEYASA
jgi:hypothetical protein